MAKRGPKPKATQHLKNTGNYRPGAHGDRADHLFVGDVICPPHVKESEVALKLWNDITGNYAKGMLAAIDSTCLGELCWWYSYYSQLRQAVESDPRDYKLFCQAAGAWNKCRELMALFGMNPSDRTSFKLPPSIQDDGDEDDFFKPKVIG